MHSYRALDSVNRYRGFSVSGLVKAVGGGGLAEMGARSAGHLKFLFAGKLMNAWSFSE
jgi:hypothetical protein